MAMRPSVLFIVLVWSAFTLAGCVATGGGSSGAAGTPNEIQTQSVTVGQTVRFMLVSSPSTGFTWTVDRSTSTGLELLSITKEGFAASEPSDGMVGAPGRQWWIVRGDAPGTASLHLRYQRPWEEDGPPARRAIITVHVRQ